MFPPHQITKKKIKGLTTMRKAYETPLTDCPYCGTSCQAEYVDVGGGMVQVSPHHCETCDAVEIGEHDKPRPLTKNEVETGWYEPKLRENK